MRSAASGVGMAAYIIVMIVLFVTTSLVAAYIIVMIVLFVSTSFV